MTLEPLNGIPLISEASKSKLYAFTLGSDRIYVMIDFNQKLLKTSCNDSMQGNF